MTQPQDRGRLASWKRLRFIVWIVVRRCSRSHGMTLTVRQLWSAREGNLSSCGTRKTQYVSGVELPEENAAAAIPMESAFPNSYQEDDDGPSSVRDALIPNIPPFPQFSPAEDQDS